MPNYSWMTDSERAELDEVKCAFYEAQREALLEAWLRGEYFQEESLEPAVKGAEKSTGTENQNPLVVEESGSKQAPAMEEEFVIVELDDVVEEGYVVVEKPPA